MNNEPNPKMDPEGSVRAAPSGEAPYWVIKGEKYCLYCECLGHTTREHHGTVGLNSPEARELAMLVEAAGAPSGEPVPLPEPDGYGGGGPAIFTEAKLIAYGDARARAALPPVPLTDGQLNDLICWWDGKATGIPDLLQETTRRARAALLSATPAAVPSEFTTGDDDLDRLLNLTFVMGNPDSGGHDFVMMWHDALEVVIAKWAKSIATPAAPADAMPDGPSRLDANMTMEALKVALTMADVPTLYRVEIIGHFCNAWNARAALRASPAIARKPLLHCQNCGLIRMLGSGPCDECGAEDFRLFENLTNRITGEPLASPATESTNRDAGPAKQHGKMNNSPGSPGLPDTGDAK